MAREKKIHIIGIGDDGTGGITATARELIYQADLVLGAQSTLELVADAPGEKIALGSDFSQVVNRLRDAQDKQTVVLASGDPLFYGVARYLCDKLGKDHFEVIPHVSSMQMAFARVKETWEEAYLTDLGNHPLASIVEKIRVADKVGLFTSDEHSPGVVAKALLDRQINYFSAYVCENLGSPDERVTKGELEELIDQQFAPLNVLILVRKPDAPDQPQEGSKYRMFGNPDDVFLQSRPKQGLLTPAEIRSLALAELGVKPDSIVWDVGAGSGSVAVEAAMLAPSGMVYALERDQADHELIEENAKKFGVRNLIASLGDAPETWAELPKPDCIFIGGSGREVQRLVELSYEELKPNGRLVANVSSIENLSAVYETLQTYTPEVKVWMVNIARGTYQLERVRFSALNPSFLIAAAKPPATVR